MSSKWILLTLPRLCPVFLHWLFVFSFRLGAPVLLEQYCNFVTKMSLDAEWCTVGFFLESQYELVLLRMDSGNPSIKNVLEYFSSCTMSHPSTLFHNAFCVFSRLFIRTVELNASNQCPFRQVQCPSPTSGGVNWRLHNMTLRTVLLTLMQLRLQPDAALSTKMAGHFIKNETTTRRLLRVHHFCDMSSKKPKGAEGWNLVEQIKNLISVDFIGAWLF